MKKKKNKNIKKIIIVGLVSIICIYFSLKNIINLDILKGFSSSIFRINNKSNIVNNKVYQAMIDDLNKEIDELKKLNNLDKVYTDKVFISANITKRSLNNWHDIFTINKGKKDGIKKGNAVLSKDGLVGEIEIVNNNTSEVKLITNTTFSAKFECNNNYYFGIIDKYNIMSNELYLNNVIGDFNEKDVIGVNVMTSGLDENIPSGLLIGKIKKVKKDKYNLSSTITIELSSNLNDISSVKVVGVK